MKHHVEKFFAGKTIFVTGHTGFKGSWLSLLLSKLGASVVGYALEPLPFFTGENKKFSDTTYNLLNIDKHIHSYIGDIRDLTNLKKVMNKVQPELVFHLAAQPLVRESYADPLETHQTNIIGTANVFEAILNVNTVTNVVSITTDKCYQNNESGKAYNENDPLGGHDPYSASKACAEIIAKSYRESFFKKRKINLATARGGNVLGGGDFAKDRIVVDIFKAILNDEAVEIRSPNAIRPWQYILDILWGYLVLMYKLSSNEEKFQSAFNFSPKSEMNLRVEDLAKLFIKYYGKGHILIEQDNQTLHEAKTLNLDSSKSRQMLAWNSVADINQCLKWTAEWYKMYATDKSKLTKFTEDHINNYLKDV